MKSNGRVISLLVIVSMLLNLGMRITNTSAKAVQSLNHGVWAVETLDGEDYSVYISIYDADATIPSGPLSVNDFTQVKSMWVTDPSGDRVGDLDLERQIVIQAQNRRILNQSPDWITDDVINSQDYGILGSRQNFNLFGDDYYFNVWLPAAYTNNDTCQNIFYTALYLGVPGGMQYEGHRKHLYEEVIKALVFPELSSQNLDVFLENFMGRFGEEYYDAYQTMLSSGGDYADLAAMMANSIEAHMFLVGNIEGLQTYGYGLQTFRDGMDGIGDALTYAEAAEKLTKDAFEGLMMHAYSNGLAAERMSALVRFADNASGLDPALVNAVHDFKTDFDQIVTNEFEAILNTMLNNIGDYLYTAGEVVAKMAMHGWGYFGVGLKILIMVFEYLYGRDDVIRTMAIDLTLQEHFQDYLLDNIGTLPTRELLLINSMKQYLSYHYYSIQVDRPDIFTDAICWDPGMTQSEYMSYITGERDLRLLAYMGKGAPDFLASDISKLISDKLDTPSIYGISPSSPTQVTKPDSLHFDVQANDDSGITRVDFRSGSYLLGSDTNGADGWTFDWNTLPYPGGQHLLEVVAQDENGLKSTATIQVELIDPGFSSDLSAYGLDAAPPSPEVGELVIFSATVKNWSVHTVTDGPVTAYVDEVPIGTELVTLNPAETTTVTYAWTVTYGAHNVRVAAEMPNDENPGNDSETMILGSVEPGLLQVAGTSTPDTLFLNLEPGTTTDRYIVLRNAGDVGLNVSASAVSPSNGSITLLSTTPFFIPGQSFHTFNFQVGMDGGAPVGGQFAGSITFTSPGGDVFQPITVTVVETQSGAETSIPMIAGWVDEDPDYYTDSVDLTPWQDLFPDGLDYSRLRFTADSVDTCPGGYCNFQTYVHDGAWFPCSGSTLFQPGDVPVQLENICGHDIGKSSVTFKIVASGGSRFYISPVSYEFKVYDGDPNLVLARQILPPTINIDQTATVQLDFENIGSNEARDPLYDESPLPYNISLVSGSLTDEVSSLDPTDTESASYVVQALQPGEYTFPSSSVVYYNATKSHAYEGSFGNSVLTVLGGTLQLVVSFDPAPHNLGQSRTITADVTDSLTGQSVSGAQVIATVTTPGMQISDVQLLYNEGLDQYVGMYHGNYELGTYSVHVTAIGPYYSAGATSPDPEFTVVTPFGLDLVSPPGIPIEQPFSPSLLHFDLENTGAAGDTAELDVTSIPTDWEWGITPGIVTLNSSQVIPGAVTVRPLASSADGSYDVTLEATSKGDPAVGDLELLSMTLDGSPPLVESIDLTPPSIIPGDTLTLSIDLDEAATLETDFSAFDSAWDPVGVTLVETDPVDHVYTATYQVSVGTEIGDGHYHARFNATDDAGNTLQATSNDVWLERNTPIFLSSDPANGEDAPFGTQVNVYFSEPMDPSATSAVITIDPLIEGSLTWANESTLVFAPNEYFLPETTYTVNIGSGAQDEAGNSLSPSSWSFTILPIDRSVEIPVGIGWSLVTLPFGPVTDLQTAEEICSSLTLEGASPVEVARWYAGGWDSHLCGLPFNDFSVAYGEGIFVRADQTVTWEVSGVPLQETLDIDLLSGWNLVGIPFGVSYTAETAGQEINAQGGSCTEIDRWYASGWDSHIIGLPFNEFDLLSGEGYFIRCDSASTWSITP